MSEPYQIKQPIYNLKTLRQEKRRLRRHIYESDKALTKKINDLPVLALLRSAKEVGNLFSKGMQRSSLNSLMSMGSQHPSFWQELLKATAIFVGTKLVKKWMQKADNNNDAADGEKVSD